MKGRTPVYVAEHGKVVVVTGNPSKDALLFANPKRNLAAVNRLKRETLQKNTKAVLERVAQAVERE